MRDLCQLREEKGKLKRLVADPSLDRHILHEIVAKVIKLRQRRELGLWTQAVFALTDAARRG